MLDVGTSRLNTVMLACPYYLVFCVLFLSWAWLHVHCYFLWRLKNAAEMCRSLMYYYNRIRNQSWPQFISIVVAHWFCHPLIWVTYPILKSNGDNAARFYHLSPKSSVKDGISLSTHSARTSFGNWQFLCSYTPWIVKMFLPRSRGWRLIILPEQTGS